MEPGAVGVEVDHVQLQAPAVVPSPVVQTGSLIYYPTLYIVNIWTLRAATTPCSSPVNGIFA